MINYVRMNLLDAPADIIVHQVNCKGVMGSGVAKTVRDLFPKTYSKYRNLCFEKGAINLLGRNLYTEEQHNGRRILVANMFGQNEYGRDRQYTNYEALLSCFEKLAAAAADLRSRNLPCTIAIPYNIGCGRGGGDWNIVSKFIEDSLADFDVFICKL